MLKLTNFLIDNNLDLSTEYNKIENSMIFRFSKRVYLGARYNVMINMHLLEELDRLGQVEDYLINKVMDIMPISEEDIERRLKECYPNV